MNATRNHKIPGAENHDRMCSNPPLCYKNFGPAVVQYSSVWICRYQYTVADRFCGPWGERKVDRIKQQSKKSRRHYSFGTNGGSSEKSETSSKSLSWGSEKRSASVFELKSYPRLSLQASMRSQLAHFCGKRTAQTSESIDVFSRVGCHVLVTIKAELIHISREPAGQAMFSRDGNRRMMTWLMAVKMALDGIDGTQLMAWLMGTKDWWHLECGARVG